MEPHQASQEKHPAHGNGEMLAVTVLVNGEPMEAQYPKDKNVRAVIVSLLPPADRPNADQYMLTDASQTPPKELGSTGSLEQGGVASGHTLSLTKKDGGGGQ